MDHIGQTPDTTADRLRSTRLGLHALAEHVLAPASYAATGHISLRATTGGFGTRWLDAGPGIGRRVRVDGLELVYEAGDDQRRARLTTVGAAAELVGIPPGLPEGLYAPATPLAPDAPLELDPTAAERLAELYAAVDQALASLGREHQGDAEAELWPEHLDLAVTVEEVNYGGSPGDADHPEPYLYVGPWSPPPPDGQFWNEPFGASRPAPAGLTADQVAAFFREGAQKAQAARPAPPDR